MITLKYAYIPENLNSLRELLVSAENRTEAEAKLWRCVPCARMVYTIEEIKR